MTKENFFSLLALARHLKMNGLEPARRSARLEQALAYFHYHEFNQRRA